MIKSNLPVIMAQKGIRTVAEITRETGISRTTLTSLYYGNGKGVQFETLESLCKMFDISVGDLLIYVSNK